jgi:uncharacterized delta-60 repeat protein
VATGALLAPAASPAHAAPADLDPTFSGNGVAVIQLGALAAEFGTAQSAYLQPLGADPSGALVFGGFSAYRTDECYRYVCSYKETTTVVRTDPDGALDPTFAGDGVLETSPYYAASPGFPVSDGTFALQPDGKVIFTRTGGSGAEVVRLDRNGDPDPSFGSGGTGAVAIPESQSAARVDVLSRPDGRVIVAALGSFGTPRAVTVTQLLPNGTVDPSFGTNGTTSRAMPALTHADLDGIALSSDGDLVVDYTLQYADENGRHHIFRLDEAGTPDPGFGTDCVVEVATPNRLAYGSKAPPVVDSLGRVYSVDPGAQRRILRLTPSGDHDESFGPDGWREIALRTDDAITSMSATHDDGVLLGIGPSLGGSYPTDMLVGRLLGDGSPDPAFGANGWATLQTSLATPLWGAAPLQLPDGRIVVSSGAVNEPCGAVVRLLGDAPGTEPPGPFDDKLCTIPCLSAQGCPVIPRTLTISAKRVGRNAALVKGTLTSEKAACLSDEAILVRAPGRHNVHRAGIEPTGPRIARYDFKLRKRFLRSARNVTVVVGPRLEPSVGTCGLAESPTITLPRPKHS